MVLAESLFMSNCMGIAWFEVRTRKPVDQSGLSSYNARFCKRCLTESNMYAVVKTGGKQYRVVAGEKLKVE
ncbi:MAG: bL21 family ribosomal protein, partial [Zoogloeaceae bacterium]|nr:bL21 family ribosomal protein [Zoogloeaceae bacterium]